MTSLPENPYASPALIAEQVVDDQHLFNHRFRSRAMRWTTWLQLGILTLVPLALVGAGCAIGAYRGAGAWLWSIATIVVTCWLCFIVMQRTSVMGYRSLETRLRDRLSAEGISLRDVDATFIQFSPAGRPYLYDNFTNWDVGFLVFFSDSIVYFGDHTRFALPLSRVEGIQAAPGFEPIHPKSSYIAWRDSPEAPPSVFAVEAGVGKSTKQLKRAQDRLEEKLREWQTGNLEPREFVTRWRHLPLPLTEAEGGKLFREAAKPLAFVINVVIVACVPAWLSNVIAMLIGVWTRDVQWSLAIGAAGGFVIMLLRGMIYGWATDLRRYPFETESSGPV